MLRNLLSNPFSLLQGDMTGLFSDYVEVHRYTPENRDYAKPEIVATFKPHKMSAVHSFAISESYAIFFNPAMTYDMSLPKMIEKNFHVLECLKYLEDEYTDVFFVNLKTGEVQEIQVKIQYISIGLSVLKPRSYFLVDQNLIFWSYQLKLFLHST